MKKTKKNTVLSDSKLKSEVYIFLFESKKIEYNFRKREVNRFNRLFKMYLTLLDVVIKIFYSNGKNNFLLFSSLYHENVFLVFSITIIHFLFIISRVNNGEYWYIFIYRLFKFGIPSVEVYKENRNWQNFLIFMIQRMSKNSTLIRKKWWCKY